MTAFKISIGGAQALECPESARFSLGGRGSDIEIPSDHSENRYLYVENRGGHPWLVPASPVVSIILSNKKISSPAPIRDGDEINIGSAHYRVRLNDKNVELLATESPQEHRGGIEPVTANKSNASTPGRIRVFRTVLFSGFLVLLLVLLFVFMATPVSISIEPEPEQWSFDGFPPPVPLQERFLVFPGSYTVTAQKKGYETLRETAVIQREDFESLAYQLTRLPGRITIYSQPSNAQVAQNGNFLGPTPLLQKKLAAGSYRIKVTKERYQDAEVDLEVEGLDREQVIRVELAPDWAPVTFRTEPAGVSVSINGEIIGRTPLTVDVLSGEHEISFERELFQSQTLELDVVAGVAMVVPMVTLNPVPATLKLSSNPQEATVSINGSFQGSTPVEIELEPDTTHEIALTRAGFETARQNVNLSPGEVDSLSLELTPQYGIVFITVDPADTALSVDGVPRGLASQRLRLTTRKHVLVFSKSGYKTQEITFTPRAGVSKSLSVELKPESAAPTTRQATPELFQTVAGQTLKLVQPGEFTMGSSRREQGRRANENLRQIELTRPYYLSTNEVTNAEFKRFKPEHDSGNAYGRSLDLDDQPVVNVTWEEAASYLNWLSAQEGLPPAYVKDGDRLKPVRPFNQGYRMPTEAEWANVARFNGSEPKKYAWGESYPPAGNAGNFADRSASGLLPYTLTTYDDSFAVSAPVGSFTPDDNGFHDLGGNVAEWTNDYYAVYPTQAGTVTRDPTGPESGRHHVVRGAGWKNSTISELRLSHRDYAENARDDVGFRIARYAQ